MRRPLALTLVLPVIALLGAGCGKQEPVSTPTACLGGTQSWLDSLKKVNGEQSGAADIEVRIGDETLISDCIPPDQPAGQQETVGRTAVETATYLSRAARRAGHADGEGVLAFQPAREAGYLVGALERGAERSQGIHATLVERVRAAATNGLERMSDSERNEYDRGHEAGLKSG